MPAPVQSQVVAGLGTETGRIQPTRVAALEGDWSLSLGIETPGRTTLVAWTDPPLQFEQVIDRGTDNNLTLRGQVFGPARMPVVTEPGPYALVDGNIAVFRADRTDWTVTFSTDDFVAIGAATATEVATVLARELPAPWSVEATPTRVLVQYLRTGRQSEIQVSGTAAAVLDFRRPCWRFLATIDGSQRYYRLVRAGDAFSISDVVLPLDSDPMISAYRLGLGIWDIDDNPGSGTDMFEVEVPSTYADDLIFGLSGRAPPFPANRVPQPEQTAFRVDDPIRFDIIHNPAAILPTVNIWIRIGTGDWELAVATGTFQPGWDGVESGSSSITTYQTRVVIDPITELPGEELVSVRLDRAAGDQVLAQWSFTTEDVTGPTLIAAGMPYRSTVRVQWSEDVDDTALESNRWVISPVDLPAVTPAIESVARVSGSVVDLMVDEISPGRRYLLTVTDVDDMSGNGSGIQSVEFIGYVHPSTPGDRDLDLLLLLPEWNRLDAGSVDLAPFVACLQEVTDTLLCEIDRFSQLVDPDTTTEPFLDMMLWDLGNPFSFPMTLAVKRKLARVLVSIYKTKGTGPGIEDAVLFLLGISVQAVPVEGSETWVLGVAELGFETVLGTADRRLLYSFDIVAEQTLSAEERDAIVAIAEAMRPAHTHLRFVVEPDVSVVEHLELGTSLLGVDWILH